jgi:hypothetical protein
VCPHRGGQRGGEHRVDLDRHHPGAHGEQPEGQRAEPGTHLHHDVVRPQVRRLDDPPHRVGVDDEVLPELLGGAQAQLGRQRAYLRRAEEA